MMRLALGLVLCMGACRSAANGEAMPSSNISSTADILADEVERSNMQTMTALEVVQKLRPAFLANSIGAGKRIGLAVTINNGAMDDVGALARIGAGQVEAIRYYTLTQAGLRFGFRANGPVIEVRLKQ